MPERRHVLTLLILSGYLVGSFFFFAFSTPATPTEAHSMHYCQCVEYVNSYYGIHVPGDAYQWIANLPDYGWNQEPSGSIEVGDIAVWDRDAMPPFGHVAIVSNISDSGQGTALTFLGANQGGLAFPLLSVMM